MGQVPHGWMQAQSMSFLNIWARVLGMMPGGTTPELFMCIAYEETRFCNKVQEGKEALAAKSDDGTLTLTSHDARNLQNVGVGFTQVQIKNPDKAQTVRDMALDPATLKFRDITVSHDRSIQLGLRYLAAKGIGGQVGGHVDRARFLKVWPQAAGALQVGLRKGSLKEVIGALNSAILNPDRRVPHNASFAGYWDFIFPPAEVDFLFSSLIRDLA
jgi:hypothetical protein